MTLALGEPDDEYTCQYTGGLSLKFADFMCWVCSSFFVVNIFILNIFGSTSQVNANIII